MNFLLKKYYILEYLRGAAVCFCCIPFTLIAIFFLADTVEASSKVEVLNEAEQLDLAHDSTWLKLIYYDYGIKESLVLTDSFFLSPEGRTNPSKELIATIDAYFTESTGDHKKDAQCRFPARYYWLSHKLASFNYDIKKTTCKRLETWELLDSVDSVSLLLVSGYFGNPASTFGHALLKLNTESDDELGLLDSTLNYGAEIPENENPLVYVMKGLFGGYEAKFSDKYFYTEDLVYSRTEFRDMWEYRLNLSEYELTLLLLHIWEIVGSKFDYYFLDKNCAYKLAELVNLVIEEELLPNNNRFWYIPEELFYRLNDIDQSRIRLSGTKFIQDVRFIPSSQRKLYYQLRLLKKNELEIFNAIVSEGIDSLSTHIKKLEKGRQIFVLDSLLAYQHYRLMAKDSKANQNRKKFKDQILLARLHLPAQPVVKVEIPELVSPAEGSRPMVIGSGFSIDDGGKNFMSLSFAPFKKEAIGDNSLEGDELAVLDFELGVLKDRNKVFVNRFDLIRILNLNTLSVKVTDESSLSWKLRLGLDRVKENEQDSYDGVFSLGGGKSWFLNNNILIYGLIDFAGHTTFPEARIRPHIGCRFDFMDFKMLVFRGVESKDYSGGFNPVWGGKIQYTITPKTSLYAEFSNERATRFSAGLNWYW